VLQQSAVGRKQGGTSTKVEGEGRICIRIRKRRGTTYLRKECQQGQGEGGIIEREVEVGDAKTTTLKKQRSRDALGIPDKLRKMEWPTKREEDSKGFRG